MIIETKEKGRDLGRLGHLLVGLVGNGYLEPKIEKVGLDFVSIYLYIVSTKALEAYNIRIWQFFSFDSQLSTHSKIALG